MGGGWSGDTGEKKNWFSEREYGWQPEGLINSNSIGILDVLALALWLRAVVRKILQIVKEREKNNSARDMFSTFCGMQANRISL